MVSCTRFAESYFLGINSFSYASPLCKGFHEKRKLLYCRLKLTRALVDRHNSFEFVNENIQARANENR